MISVREMAGLIWLGVLLVAALAYGPTRKSVPSILLSFAKPPLLVAFSLYFAWIALGVYIGHLAGGWNPSMLGPTIVWTLLVGIPLIFGMTNAAKDPRWLLHQLRALLSVTILLEFMVNVRTFPLAVEFTLQGSLGFLVLLASVASLQPEHHVVAKAINLLMGITALVLASVGITRLVTTWAEQDWHQTMLSLIMPLWLGAWAAAFVALLGLYSNLERIFRLMSLQNPRRLARFWRILPLALRAGWRPKTICKCHGYWYNKIANSSGIREANQVVGEFLEYLANDDALVAAAAQKLVDNAGLQGTDDEGAQLDQREFKETWDALETIMLWFHGWYAKNAPGHDLAKIQQIMAIHQFNDLPEPHGITARVSPDGESCYAMRQTITGRVLAVGLHGHDFRHWDWDGDHEPNGYPGKGGDWGADWAAQAFNPNR